MMKRNDKNPKSKKGEKNGDKPITQTILPKFSHNGYKNSRSRKVSFSVHAPRVYCACGWLPAILAKCVRR